MFTTLPAAKVVTPLSVNPPVVQFTVPLIVNVPLPPQRSSTQIQNCISVEAAGSIKYEGRSVN